MEKSKLKKVNRVALTLLLILGITTLVFTLIDLNDVNPDPSYEDDQSRIEFRWGSRNTTFFVILLILSLFLTYYWKRLFPYNGPIAIFLAGFWYELVFKTFTVGWVGMVGLMGLAISLLTGLILIIYHTIFLIAHKKSKRSSSFK
jgi:hypothetical protein